MLQNTFKRDIVMLVVISIIIGSLMASAVSLSANAYFSQALANLVGDYGEYDLLIQSREEIKEDTATHIQKILDEAFPGARLKEGPTITGKTNFFVALPDNYKSKQVYEDLGKTFGGIPGGAGVGVLTEPRLTVRGVPEGAKNMVMEQVMQMAGVKFAFRDGASVGVILQSLDKSPAVSSQIKELLAHYQVIEISFPVGSEPANPIRLGENIALDMKNNLNVNYATNASVDGRNDDMTAMVSSMMEMRRFLMAYQTQVLITPTNGAKILKGDQVVLAGQVDAEITAIRADGVAEAVIKKGDASAVTGGQVYKPESDSVIGTAQLRNPRQQLSGALTETSRLVLQIPGITQDTQAMSRTADGVLTQYSGSIATAEQTLSGIETAGRTLETATAGLSGLDTTFLRNQIDNSAQALGGLANTLQVMRLVDNSAGAAADNVAAAQQNLTTLRSGLEGLDSIATNARQAKKVVDGVVADGYRTTAALRAFDVKGTRDNLNQLNQRINQLGQIDVPLVSTQLQYLAAAAPKMTDGEIYGSIKTLDQFIAGQVIPGERIQILTTTDVSLDAVKPIVAAQVGHNNAALYTTALGVIEPDARGELYKVLTEVKAILAGMTAIIVTILFLALDHTAVMVVVRWKRLYGMTIGAVLLSAMFALSHGGIPYLPWLAVPVVGALLGLLIAHYAEKISPVSNAEIMAGESLGLSFDEIMREIVIPAARPGLLQQLNRRKQKLR